MSWSLRVLHISASVALTTYTIDKIYERFCQYRETTRIHRKFSLLIPIISQYITAILPIANRFAQHVRDSPLETNNESSSEQSKEDETLVGKEATTESMAKW